MALKKKCSKCGTEVTESVTVCPKCFSFIEEENKVNEEENKNNKTESTEVSKKINNNYLNKYFLDIVLKHYINFKGREGRKVFWLYTLNCFIISSVAGLISADLVIIISLLLLLPSCAIIVRRLQDANLNGWFIILFCIPYVVVVAMLFFGCIPGTKGENKYGMPPNNDKII